jgi:hypothetical protein
MDLTPGRFTTREISDAVKEMSAKHDPGTTWFLNQKPPPGVAGVSMTHNGRKVVSAIPGRVGYILHEGGHHAARKNVPGMDTELYMKALKMSQQYGWLAGAGLLPNALLDDAKVRPELSKWGPALAMLPSLPTIIDETAANIYGGMEALQQGHAGAYAAEALPGYGRHLARAATVPAGLWMVHKLKQREAAAEEKARASYEEQMLAGAADATA